MTIQFSDTDEQIFAVQGMTQTVLQNTVRELVHVFREQNEQIKALYMLFPQAKPTDTVFTKTTVAEVLANKTNKKTGE